jgi:hypothetical protein
LNNLGAKSHVKLWVQGILALAIGLFLWWMPKTQGLITDVMVPFYKYPLPLAPVWSVTTGLALTMLTIVGSSNAVNLTDGLDGLAASPFQFNRSTYGSAHTPGYSVAVLELPLYPTDSLIGPCFADASMSVVLRRRGLRAFGAPRLSALAGPDWIPRVGSAVHAAVNASARADSWRPWRAYAVQYLWASHDHPINHWPINH